MYRLCFAALVLLCQYGCAGTATIFGGSPMSSKTLGDQAERQEVGNHIEEFAGTLGWARADKANGSPLNPYHHSDTIIINKGSDLLGQPLRYKKIVYF